MSNKLDEVYEIDEGLLDQIVDKIAGKTAKAGQLAKNFSAFMRGDKDSIGDPKQAEEIRKLERNIVRIKEKYEELIQELGEDLTAAIGTPDDGPFKKVVDEFDDATQVMSQALANLSIEIDNADDMLPPEGADTDVDADWDAWDKEQEEIDSSRLRLKPREQDAGDALDMSTLTSLYSSSDEEEFINEETLKHWNKIIE